MCFGIKGATYPWECGRFDSKNPTRPVACKNRHLSSVVVRGIPPNHHPPLPQPPLVASVVVALLASLTCISFSDVSNGVSSWSPFPQLSFVASAVVSLASLTGVSSVAVPHSASFCSPLPQSPLVASVVVPLASLTCVSVAVPHSASVRSPLPQSPLLAPPHGASI